MTVIQWPGLSGSLPSFLGHGCVQADRGSGSVQLSRARIGGSTVLDIVKTPTPETQDKPRSPVCWDPGSHYQYRSDRHELIRVVERIEDAHVVAFRQGVAEFALVLEGPLLVFCSRFSEALPWSASSYLWHRLPRAERTIPADLRAGSEVALEVSLLEAHNGQIAATRIIWLPSPFAQVLLDAILEQVRFSFDPSAERRALDALQRRCPSTRALVAYATVRAVVD
jgi:hypothetical protein